MHLELDGNAAVVIGGAKGIGLAIGEALANEGCNLCLVDIDENVNDAAKSIADSTSVRVQGQIADVTNFGQMCDVANAVCAEFQRCDHIVYAAGIGSGKYGFPFWNLSPDDWRRVIEINLQGAVNVAHAFAPRLVEAKSGTVLFLSSVAGQIGSQTDPPYSAAKAAIINFAQCAAKDLAPYNVRVNVICPGMVKTTLNQSVWQAWHDQQGEGTRQDYDVWAQQKIKNIAPLGRWQTPEDIASMATFLASAKSKNITGQTINVDGGQVMHW